MVEKKPNQFGWFAHGPFGAWGRKLGFRWVFPIGTMPVPFHPLFLPLALAGVIAWTIRSALTPVVHAIGPGWPGMLFAAGLLGLTMSVPIVSWAVMALGGRIIQSGLFLCSMVVILVQGLRGTGPSWMTVVPASYFAIWLAQFTVGLFTKQQLLAQWERLEPPTLGSRPLALSQNFTWGTPVDLLNRYPITELWQPGQSDDTIGRGHFRLTSDDVAAVRAVTGAAMPDGWKLKEWSKFWLLEHTGQIPDNAVRVTNEPWHAPMRSVAPGLLKVSVDDGRIQTAIWGKICAIAPIPLFEAFHWTAIFGGKSQWLVGFVYGRGIQIGAADDCLSGLVKLPDAPQPLPAARLTSLLDELTAAVASRRNMLNSFRAAITADPADYTPDNRALHLLRMHGPDALGDDAGPFLLDWLHRARDARKRDTVRIVAGLIAKLSDAAFAALAPGLFGALNSRKLALEWKLVPGFDPTPLPKETPRFGNLGGFGLIFSAPSLYVRLGDVHPPARGLVAELAKEMELPESVMKAIKRWRAEEAAEPEA